MNQILFTEETQTPRTPALQRSGYAAWLVTHSNGLLKNEGQANALLVIFIIVSVLISISLSLGDSIERVDPRDIPIDQR